MNSFVPTSYSYDYVTIVTWTVTPNTKFMTKTSEFPHINKRLLSSFECYRRRYQILLLLSLVINNRTSVRHVPSWPFHPRVNETGPPLSVTLISVHFNNVYKYSWNFLCSSPTPSLVVLFLTTYVFCTLYPYRVHSFTVSWTRYFRLLGPESRLTTTVNSLLGTYPVWGGPYPVSQDPKK